jgi:hypothetical protein
MKETTKNAVLRQGSEQDSKQEPHDYKSEASTLQPTFPVTFLKFTSCGGNSPSNITDFQYFEN